MQKIWPLFGSANQLLSVLALVACAVFLKKTKRQGCMLWIPMVFMMAVTFTALGMTISKLTKALFTTGLDLGNTLQLIFAVLLLILGVLVAIQGVKKLFEKNDGKTDCIIYEIKLLIFLHQNKNLKKRHFGKVSEVSFLILSQSISHSHTQIRGVSQYLQIVLLRFLHF